MSENNRISRVNELVKRELGAIVKQDVDLPEGTLLTITEVEAFPNLQQARVYISVMPEQKNKEVRQILGGQIYGIQQALNKRLRMRPVPKIQWMEDTASSQIQKVEELLDKIKEEEA